MNVMNGKTSRSATAFTLIELLVVMAIIIILAALSAGGFSRARGLSRRTFCAGNLRQINIGLTLYLDENEETFPVASSLPSLSPSLGEPSIRIADVLLSYSGNEPKLFHCPSDQGETSFFNREGSSYEYNSRLNGLPRHASDITNYGEATVPVLFDYDCFHAVLPQPKVKNYLFVDGHVGDLD